MSTILQCVKDTFLQTTTKSSLQMKDFLELFFGQKVDQISSLSKKDSKPKR